MSAREQGLTVAPTRASLIADESVPRLESLRSRIWRAGRVLPIIFPPWQGIKLFWK